MKNSLVRLSGIAAPYLRDDVLIDYIAPPVVGGSHHGGGEIIRREHSPAGARVSPQQAAQHAFPLDRFLPDGRENPDFILNRPAWRDASILLAGANFGKLVIKVR